MSVFTLIKDLCSELVKENYGTECDLSKAKRIAFEILLKRSYQNENDFFDGVVVKDFQFCSFELMLVSKLDDAIRVEKFTDVLKENSELVAISSLLLQLKNIKSKTYQVRFLVNKAIFYLILFINSFIE